MAWSPISSCSASRLPAALPASVWGMSDDVAARWANIKAAKEPGYSGMGTTLSANPLQFAAMRATLERGDDAGTYAHMEKLAARLERGLGKAIARHRLPWHVARVGARVEFICAPGPLRNGARGGSRAPARTRSGDPSRRSSIAAA